MGKVSGYLFALIRKQVENRGIIVRKGFAGSYCFYTRGKLGVLCALA